MQLVIIPKLWPFTRKGAPLMLLTALSTMLPYVILKSTPNGLEEGPVFEFMFMMFGFVWLPIFLSYCISAFLHTREIKIYLKSNFNINYYQRSVAFLIGNSICTWLAQKQFDSETATIAALLLLTFAFPIQVLVTLFIDIWIYLKKRYKS